MTINAHTIQYRQQLLSESWRLKRQQILQRDGCKCRNCGSVHALEVHHRQYHVHPATGRLRQPWDYADQYLVTLCRSCHEKDHAQFRIPTYKH